MYGPDEQTTICLTVGQDIMMAGEIKTCENDTCITVDVDAYCEIYVPNALYPTDASSDAHEFLPKGKSLEKYQLQIFDKFGNLLWETNDERGGLNYLDGSPAIGWKGTTQDGSVVPQGTYIWKIEATCSNDKPWKGTGDNGKTTGLVYLIR